MICRSSKSFRSLWCFALTVLLFLIISCSKREISKNKTEYSESLPADTVGAVKGDWVVIGIYFDPRQLNPWVARSTFGITGYIFESLNEIDLQTFELVPQLASVPEISSDRLIYTYTLNPLAKFSDGTHVTAEDVVFSFKAVKNPYVDDPGLRALLVSVIKAEVADRERGMFKVYLSKPSFGAAQNIGDIWILPKHVLDPDNLTDQMDWSELADIKSAEKNASVKKFGEFINSSEVSTEPRYLVGSGTYKLEKWDSRQAVILLRNEFAWRQNEEPCYPDKLVFKIITDENAAFIALKNKEIDVAYQIDPGANNDSVQLAKFDVSRGIYPYPHYLYVGWNERLPLFQDKRVRTALACLFDKNAIGEKLLPGTAVPIQSVVYYLNKKYLNDELPVTMFDPSRGKQLLREARWEDTDGDNVLDKIIDGKKTDFRFTFLCEPFDIEKKVMLVYAKELEKAGIKAEIQPLESTVMFEKITTREFEAEVNGRGLDPLPNPSQYFRRGGDNEVTFNNKEADSLLDIYDREFDESKRSEVLKKWQKLIFTEQPFLLLWTLKRVILFDRRFRNARPFNYGYHYNEWWVPKELQKYR